MKPPDRIPGRAGDFRRVRIALEHPDPATRGLAASQLSDQTAVLLLVALTTEPEVARSALLAPRRPIDGEELAFLAESSAQSWRSDLIIELLAQGRFALGQDGWVDLALRAGSPNARLQAAARVRSPEHLAKLHYLSADEAVRGLIVQRVGKVPSVEPPDIQSRDLVERHRAVSWVVDDRLLEAIALNDSDEGTRQRAIDRVRSVPWLSTQATTASSPLIRGELVRRLADQALLERIARTDALTVVRSEAVSRILDPEVLRELAQRDPDEGVRAAAVEGLDDQDLLSAIARSDDINRVRLEAVKRLTRSLDLTAIALGDEEDLQVREIAIRRLENAAVLESIALDDAKEWIALRASERLIGRDALLHLAVGSRHEKVRARAVPKVADPAVLHCLAVYDGADEVRLGAIERTFDAPLLEKIVLSDSAARNRLAALSRLSDQTALARITIASTDPVVRLEASYRLEDLELVESIARRDPDPVVRDGWGPVRVRVRGRIVTEAGGPLGNVRVLLRGARGFRPFNDRQWCPSQVTRPDGTFEAIVPLMPGEPLRLARLPFEYLEGPDGAPISFAQGGAAEIDLGDIVWR